MKSIRRQAYLPYSAMQMFQLVDDIEQYPQFLPNCQAAKELERTEQLVVATLSVAKGSFHKDFTTRNYNQPGKSIKMELVDGPFKSLQGYWDFHEIAQDACKVELLVEFEFASFIGNLAFGPVFSQMAESFVDAFSKRAKQVYG